MQKCAVQQLESFGVPFLSYSYVVVSAIIWAAPYQMHASDITGAMCMAII